MIQSDRRCQRCKPCNVGPSWVDVNIAAPFLHDSKGRWEAESVSLNTTNSVCVIAAVSLNTHRGAAGRPLCVGETRLPPSKHCVSPICFTLIYIRAGERSGKRSANKKQQVINLHSLWILFIRNIRLKKGVINIKQ